MSDASEFGAMFSKSSSHSNGQLRKSRTVVPAGVATMLARLTGSHCSQDWSKSAARFSAPSAVTVDSAGNVYVADSGNHTIRRGYAAPVTEVNLFITSGPGFDFILTGPAGQSVVVEAPKNLMNWLPLWTNTFTGVLSFSDSQSGGYSNRFYRTVSP